MKEVIRYEEHPDRPATPIYRDLGPLRRTTLDGETFSITRESWKPPESPDQTEGRKKRGIVIGKNAGSPERN